jgi:uncharacterized protein (TIGR03067 family)
MLIAAVVTGFGVHAAQAGDGKLDKLEPFMMSYHQKPEPKRVPEMLELALDEKLLAEMQSGQAHADVLLAHSFGHMARANAKLVRHYEDKFAKAGKLGRAILLTSLRLCGDADTVKKLAAWRDDPAFKAQRTAIDETHRFLSDPKRKLPRDLPPTMPDQLDLLWADFFVTGEYAPLARLLDVVDRPDSVRPALEKWSKDNAERRNKVNALLADLKLLKPGSKDQWIDGNLEIAAMHDARGRVQREALGDLIRLLAQDVKLGEDQLLKGIVLTMTASWSMQSNLDRFPAIEKHLRAHYRERPEQSQVLIKKWLRLDEFAPKLSEEMKRLQGTWQMISWQEDGDRMDAKVRTATLKYVQWIFKNDELHMTKAFTVTTNGVTEVRGQGGTNTFTFSTETAGKQKSIKTTRTSGAFADDVHEILYAIEGDQLKACFFKEKQGPPADFSVPEGSGRIMVTLKKAAEK